MKKGKTIKRNSCRLCQSKKLTEILDFGFMPLAGDYLLKKDLGKEKVYPLKIYYCNNCYLVQVLNVIKPDTLFGNYHYLSSIGLTEHFKKYAQEMVNKFINRGGFVVEIGSNDGVLLQPLKRHGIRVLGVDPAKNVARIAIKQGYDTLIDYFGVRVVEKIIKEKGKADAVFANNVLAHIDDLDDVISGIKLLLKPEGVLVFEVHYLYDLIAKLQYDFFYNEHLSYYTLTSLIPFLKKFGLVIFDVKKIPIHSGSIRVYVKSKKNSLIRVKKNVKNILENEKKEGVLGEEKLMEFALRVYEHKKRLRELLVNLKRSGEKIVGYGASGRGNTLLNFCKIDNKIIDYIVDESSERQNRYTPGTHIPIVAPDIFRKDDVKHALLLAWNYKDIIGEKEKEFIKKGGKFVVPLPNIHYYP